ncbi:hypothetical protein MHH81_21045 [Psychrobacillus sp. FSL H8-0484]|uniref:hypothetical protein n=1 Tax=Psychrobacillus sp. FSL H8-0484 TaxID=2921390 RepID=UPI0030FCE7BE
MGKSIVSWSPVHGQSATTSNTVALASMFSLDGHNHSLLTHTQLTYSTLEYLFQSDNPGFDDGGMEALERLVKSKLLKSEAIPDYAITIYKNRLDLLLGSNKAWDNSVEADRLLRSVLNVAATHYNTLWIDAHSGTFNHTSKSLFKDADLVLVNLPQNKYIIESFFNGESFPEELKGKPYVVLISTYDENASFSIRNIKRTFKVKVPLYPIMYSSGYRDAINQQEVSDFFYRSVNLKKGDREYSFIESLRAANKGIMKAFDVNVTEGDQL